MHTNLYHPQQFQNGSRKYWVNYTSILGYLNYILQGQYQPLLGSLCVTYWKRIIGLRGLRFKKVYRRKHCKQASWFQNSIYNQK